MSVISFIPSVVPVRLIHTYHDHEHMGSLAAAMSAAACACSYGTAPRKPHAGPGQFGSPTVRAATWRWSWRTTLPNAPTLFLSAFVCAFRKFAALAASSMRTTRSPGLRSVSSTRPSVCRADGRTRREAIIADRDGGRRSRGIARVPPSRCATRPAGRYASQEVSSALELCSRESPRFTLGCTQLTCCSGSAYRSPERASPCGRSKGDTPMRATFLLRFVAGSLRVWTRLT